MSDCEDRLEVANRVLRRHFWRRLLPSVGVTSFMAVGTVVGVGTHAMILTAVFGLFTAREALRFRQNLSRLRGVEMELASLIGGGSR